MTFSKSRDAMLCAHRKVTPEHTSPRRSSPGLEHQREAPRFKQRRGRRSSQRSAPLPDPPGNCAGSLLLEMEGKQNPACERTRGRSRESLPCLVHPGGFLRPPVRRAAVGLGGPPPPGSHGREGAPAAPHTSSDAGCSWQHFSLPRKDWHPSFQCCQPRARQLQLSWVVLGLECFF